MDSIVIHLKSATKPEVEAFLDNLLPLQRDPWIVVAPHGEDPRNPAIYVHVEDPASEFWPSTPEALLSE